MVIFLGIIASILVVALALTVQRMPIIAVSAALSVVTAVQYALLDRWSAVALGLVTLAYGLIAVMEGKWAWLRSKAVSGAVIAAYAGMFLALNGWTFSIDIIAFVASISGVLLMMVNNPLVAKWMMLANGIAWTAYQVFTGAYGQLPGEALFVVGVVASLIMLHRAQSAGKDLASVPEAPALVKSWIASRSEIGVRTVPAT